MILKVNTAYECARGNKCVVLEEDAESGLFWGYIYGKSEAHGWKKNGNSIDGKDSWYSLVAEWKGRKITSSSLPPECINCCFNVNGAATNGGIYPACALTGKDIGFIDITWECPIGKKSKGPTTKKELIAAIVWLAIQTRIQTNEPYETRRKI